MQALQAILPMIAGQQPPAEPLPPGAAIPMPAQAPEQAPAPNPIPAPPQGWRRGARMEFQVQMVPGQPPLAVPVPPGAAMPMPARAPIPAPAQARQVRPGLPPEPATLGHLFSLHANLVEKTNWNNSQLLAKPFLSLMTLISAVAQGKEKRVTLYENWKAYLAHPPHLAQFEKCRLELEDVVKEIDKLSSLIQGSPNLFAGIASRFHEQERKIAAQKTEILALQQRLFRADTSPPDEEVLPKGQQTLDKWFVAKKK
jgi:hypothetical protein